MPHFFVDDQFSDSKEVMAIPARHRLAAVGLWTLCGSWSANKLQNGFVPDEVIKRLGGRPALVSALCEITGPDGEDWSLWHRVSSGIRFVNWAKWQRTREQVMAYREREAEKKRNQRANGKKPDTRHDSEMSPGDANGDNVTRPHGTPHTPIPEPKPVPNNQSGTASSELPSANARPRNRTFTEMAGGRDHPPPPDPGPHVIAASAIVSRVMPSGWPPESRGKLNHYAGRMLENNTSVELVEASLHKWLTKTHLGEPALSACLAEVLKERHQQTNGAKPSGASAKAQGILDAGARLAARFDNPDQPGIEAP